MGSKLPPLTSTLLASLVADSSSSSPALLSALQTLEPRAQITTLDPTSSDVLSTFYASYILALLLCDDLPEARALSHRIDAQILHNDPAVISAYRVLQALWSKDYITFHQTMQNAPWGEVTAILASQVLQKHRTSTLNLLSTAYTSLPPSLAQKYLGVSDEPRTVKMLTEENPQSGFWFNATKGFLVIPEGAKPGINARAGNKATEGEIGRLAGLGGFLSDM
ncbi:hypothetical protein H072_9073 [Dactylellina haptotyla CBS 200.50]|uniref:CSN8/PSMD8/EIF3K domain-containing protein n=1 Tax=Dactylellina haptotyla (strain CBS 200.50) TaxID=1284197 RepID=S8A2P4_DACHA|nr:hypothetical protein H072_9073 [Dactylellina haptotyla CBS 200.50]